MAIRYLPQAERLLSGQLSALLSDSATTMTVSNPPSASRVPTYIELEPDSVDDRETVRVTNVSGSVCTIERGVYSSGVGKQHLQNATYKEKITQKHWDAIVDAVESGYLTEDESLTFAKSDSDTFTITGADRSTVYTVGRRVRLNGSINLTVVSSSYGTNVTTVNVSQTTVPTTITSVEVAIEPEGQALDTSAFATLTGTQVLTNKTLTAPTINGGTVDKPVIKGVYDNGNSGAAKEVDWANGDRQKVTMTDNCTFTFAHPIAGQYLTLQFIQDGTGNRTVALPSGKWPGAQVGAFSTTASAIDILIVYYDGTNYYYQLAAAFG